MVRSYFENYKRYWENIDRYFPPAQVEQIISDKKYEVEKIGWSEESRPIYLLKMGKGKIKLLFWAQMHGNESTASRAMFDVWNVLHSTDSWVNAILDAAEIHFIPQLNPDGAQYYTRTNANGCDINRDFHNRKTNEMIALQNMVNSEKYHYLFNLHDQRTIFHPENQHLPATLSFLAPVIDQNKTLPQNRMYAMKVISSMVRELNQYIPKQLAKFTDEFYPDATGDNFQKLGYPTILVECGHFPNNYDKSITRKYTFIALLTAIETIANGDIDNFAIAEYEQLPENANKAVDILYKNVRFKSANDYEVKDLAIQYREELNNGEIKFTAEILDVGDLSEKFGYRTYDAENRIFNNSSNNIPTVGSIANFKLSDWVVENGIVVNQE